MRRCRWWEERAQGEEGGRRELMGDSLYEPRTGYQMMRVEADELERALREREEQRAPVTGVEVAKPPPNPNNLDALVKELKHKSKAFHAELAVKGETLRDVRQEVIAGMGRQQANQRRAELLPAAPPSNKRGSLVGS